MNIGKLNKRIEIQRIVETVDTYGEPIQTWTTLAKRWASVSPLTGREALSVKQINATTTHTVTIRYLEGLTTEDRILFGTRYLNIDSVTNPDERNEMQVMQCTEVAQ